MLLLKRLLNRLLRLTGYTITSTPKNVDYYVNIEMTEAVGRFKKRCENISTIIDVGAAAGSWSLSINKYWPTSTYVLFEPLAERKLALEKIEKENENFIYLPYAVGNKEGLINFFVSDDLDGSGISSASENDKNIRDVKITSLDLEIDKLNLSGPFIVKLDTHGFEVPILEGCEKCMKDVSLFIIECYGFQIAKDSLLFWEMCAFMDKKGFRLLDIVDIMRRPKDEAFWQCDAFFVPKENEIFSSNTYS